MSEPDISPAPGTPESTVEAGESYQRGLALRKAGLFKPAIEQFEKAASNSAYALKAYAHIGLSYKSFDRYDEAVTAFRNALKAPGASQKEIVQILYVLGRTLESLGRIPEALEAYRWLRREDCYFRDTGARIELLSTGRIQAGRRPAPRKATQQNIQTLRTWHSLLRKT